MKLKSQIAIEAENAKEKMKYYYKKAEDDVESHDWALYYEGMRAALEWVLESRTIDNHCV